MKGKDLDIRYCSICVPLICYIIFLGIVLRLSVPLRSKELMAPQALEDPYKNMQEIQEPVIEYKEINKAVPPIQLLTMIFQRVDQDNDKLISIQELSSYIHKRTKEHINQAMQENYGLFMAIDKSPRNGVISWDEYHHYFLHLHGIDEQYIKTHTERHAGLGRSLKEMIARDKASWSEAARSDPDFLTLDEFLAFRHPESSHATILTLVDDLLDKLDRDGDETLTEDEFALLQVGGGEKIVSQGEDERRQEFRSLIDTDANGRADRNELLLALEVDIIRCEIKGNLDRTETLMERVDHSQSLKDIKFKIWLIDMMRYIDPKNPRHAKEEAETLVTLSDVDHDGQLSLSEVLTKMDLFLGSKMVDTARSFHDEF